MRTRTGSAGITGSTGRAGGTGKKMCGTAVYGGSRTGGGTLVACNRMAGRERGSEWLAAAWGPR